MSRPSDYAVTLRDAIDNFKFHGEHKVLRTTEFISRFTMSPDMSKMGERFSFKGHEWQKDMLDDVTIEQVCQKCSQIGVSEIYLRKAIAMVVHFGLNVTYVMPTFEMIKSYVPSRFDPVIQTSPKLSSMLKKPDNTRHKMFKNGKSLHISHSNSEAARVATSLDMVVMDEFDRCDDANYDAWPQRLGHSVFKIYDCFSTPTVADYGINSLFQESDQKHYWIKCECCGEWQKMTFPDNIFFKKGLVGLPEFYIEMPERTGVGKRDWKEKYVEREPYIGCVKCEKPLNRNRENLREWVADFPHRSDKISGRQLNRFDVPWNPVTRRGHTAITILDVFFQMKGLLEFFNQVLGLPYDKTSDSIEDKDLKACLASEMSGFVSLLTRSTSMTFMGIDQGKNLHIVIYRVNGKYLDLVHAQEMQMAKGVTGQEYGLDEVISEVSSLARKFRVRYGVCDGAPDINLPRALNKAMPDTFSWAFFNANMNGFTKPTDAKRSISINRTWVLSEVADMVKRNHDTFEMRLPRNLFEEQIGKEFKSHLTSMKKSTVEKPDKKTNQLVKETVWLTKASRPNHFMLASCYAYVAASFVYDKSDRKRSVPLSLGYTVVETRGLM